MPASVIAWFALRHGQMWFEPRRPTMVSVIGRADQDETSTVVERGFVDTCFASHVGRTTSWVGDCHGAHRARARSPLARQPLSHHLVDGDPASVQEKLLRTHVRGLVGSLLRIEPCGSEF